MNKKNPDRKIPSGFFSYYALCHGITPGIDPYRILSEYEQERQRIAYRVVAVLIDVWYKSEEHDTCYT